MDWTVKLQTEDMGYIEVTDLNGQGPYIYRVNHVHMHGPSEHKLDGRQEDLEIHIVHELVDGPGDWRNYKEKLAVVGVLFRVDEKSHPFIEKLRPLDFGEIEAIDLSELIGEGNLYHYKGSLTNPPCADVVNWLVQTRVLPISKEHLESFRDIWYEYLGHGNFRDCQPLCERRVVRNFH